MSIWFSLIRKELEEHKWKLASLCSMVLAILIAGIIESRGQDAIGIVAVMYSYMLIAPLYLGMGVSAGEHSNRSISFVNAMPCSSWKAGAARLITGWIVLVVPLLLVLATSLFFIAGLQWSGRNPGNIFHGSGLPEGWSPYAELCLIVFLGTGWCTNLYAWICLTTSNQKTELRAGLIGLTTIMLLLFSGMVVVGTTQMFYGGAGIFRSLIFSIGPIIWMFWGEFVQRDQLGIVVVAAFVQVCAVISLLTVSAIRYGGSPLLKLDWLPKFNWKIAHGHGILPAPLKSTRSALFWMQFRQSVPIVCTSLVIFVLVWGINQSQPSFSRFDMFQTIGPFIGCVMALVIGIGSFVHELEPQLYTFWRSRPISPTRWFWLKYFAGAIVVVGCFDLPLLALSRVTTPPQGDLGVELFPILLHLFVYSVSVLAACAIRHPVYSPILAVCGMLAFLFGPDAIQVSLGFNVSILGKLSFFELWRDFAFARYSQPRWICLLLAIFLMFPITLFTGWLSGWLIKKDISFSP